MDIILTLIFGGIAGWLGSVLYSGSSLGILGNIIVGIVGSMVGYWVFDFLGIRFESYWIGIIITGATGAFIILYLANLIAKKRR